MKRELIKFGVNCNWKGQIVRSFLGRSFILVGKLFLISLSHIEGISMCGAEEIYETAGRASAIGLMR